MLPQVAPWAEAGTTCLQTEACIVSTCSEGALGQGPACNSKNWLCLGFSWSVGPCVLSAVMGSSKPGWHVTWRPGEEWDLHAQHGCCRTQCTWAAGFMVILAVSTLHCLLWFLPCREGPSDKDVWRPLTPQTPAPRCDSEQVSSLFSLGIVLKVIDLPPPESSKTLAGKEGGSQHYLSTRYMPATSVGMLVLQSCDQVCQRSATSRLWCGVGHSCGIFLMSYFCKMGTLRPYRTHFAFFF